MRRRRYECWDRTCGSYSCGNCYPGGDPTETEEEERAREDAHAEARIAAEEDRRWRNEVWESAR